MPVLLGLKLICLGVYHKVRINLYHILLPTGHNAYEECVQNRDTQNPMYEWIETCLRVKKRV